MPVPPLDPRVVRAAVTVALAEDVGAGDLTSRLVPEGPARAVLRTREDGVLCGQSFWDETFRQLSPAVEVVWRSEDGARIRAGEILCETRGPARALLTAERTAINFLQTLSGTATAARRYADCVAHTPARILDTRKTLPGMRLAQKYAVRCGGCDNHRMGLFDAVLIKENHIAAAGGIASALNAACALAPGVSIEIEVETLAQLEEALQAGATRILLDNFALPDLAAAVRATRKRATLEASGGITLENAAAVAETGVDFLSVGELTKSVRALDLSLRIGP